MKQQEIKILEKKIKEELRVTKLNKNLRYFLWTLFGIMVLIGGAYASTIITDQSVNSPEGIYTNISADMINEVLYVQAGNGSDIQVKLNLANASGGGKVIVPNSNYTLTTTINVPSYVSLIFDKHANIFYNQDSGNVFNLSPSTYLEGGYIWINNNIWNDSVIYINGLDRISLQNNIIVRDMYIKKSGGINGTAIFLDGTKGTSSIVFTKFENVEFEYFKYGIKIDCIANGY